MKRIFFLILFAALCGCSKQGGLSLSGTKGSGDLVAMMMECVTNRGGRAFTNAPPIIQTTWTYQKRDVEDIIIADGDHFAEIQKFLEQAYGAPDSKLGSLPISRLSGRLFVYSPGQAGVLLELGGSSSQTIVTVMLARLN